MTSSAHTQETGQTEGADDGGGRHAPAQAGPALVGVVDDDASVRRALAALLRSVGLQALGFASGDELMGSSQRARLGCLVVDLRMQGMSGLELQQALRAAGCSLPMVFVSAHGSAADRQRALASGALGFLAKPFDETALLALVRQALQRPAPAGDAAWRP